MRDLDVYGGTASNGFLSGHGVQEIYGGVAEYTTVTNYGEDVVAGGTSWYDSVSGFEALQSVISGTANKTTVGSEGVQYLYGGIAIGTTINSGGSQTIYAGDVSGDIINSGATVTQLATTDSHLTIALNGGTLGATRLNGGTLILESGTQVGVIDIASGTLVIDITGTDTLSVNMEVSGSEIEFSDVTITNPETVTTNNQGYVTIGPDVFNFARTGEKILITQSSSIAIATAIADGTEIPCFCAGTMILTPNGQIPVETLNVGDLVQTSSAGAAAIRWIGSRHVNCRRHPAPEKIWPFRIAAHAFAPGIPTNDLLLSPDHAIFAGGVLIPVKYLENGTTVVQVKVDQVTYVHIELDRHQIVFADGLTCETYLDTDNRRHAFSNASGPVRMHPLFAPGEAGEAIWEAAAYAPLHIDGEIVDRVAARLRRRSSKLGFKPAATSHRRRRAANVTATSPAALFDPSWYLSNYRDVAKAGVDASQHYEVCGRAEGRLPCPEVDLIRALGLVDRSTIIFTMGDVIDAGLDPVAHFCASGWRERRRPNFYFDTGWYAANYTVPEGMNPLLHYALIGERQGFQPSPHFEPAWYRKRYAIADRESPLAHYLLHRRSGRFSPHPSFDVASYRDKQAETLSAGRDPYAHFLVFGESAAPIRDAATRRAA